MRELFTNTFLRGAVAIVGGYALAAQFVQADALIEFLSVVLLALAVGVAVGYTPGLYKAARTNALDYANLLITGIVLGMVATAFLRTNILFWYNGGQPSWLLTHHLLGMSLLWHIVACVLHLLAPEAVDGAIPRRRWLVMGGMVSAGMFAAGSITLLDPDWSDIVRAIEPYVPR